MQALIFSVPGRSLLLLQVLHSHICTRVGSKHLPHPAPHSHPQKQLCQHLCNNLLWPFTFCSMGEEKKKKKGDSELLRTSEQEKNSSERPRAAPGAEAEEAWGPAREAVLQAPASRALRGFTEFQAPGSDPASALWHRAASLASATCPHCLLLQSWTETGSARIHIQTQ